MTLLPVALALAQPSPATRTIPLRYDAALLAAGFPSPAARLTINGRSAWFLFDSGAGVHALGSWLAADAGLKVDESFGERVSGVDSTGRAIDFRGVHALAARLEDGTDLGLGTAAVTDLPADFREHGVGGVVSPQLLAGAGQAVVLDLRFPELRLEPFGQAVGRVGARVVSRGQVTVCGSRSDAVHNLLFAVSVSAGRQQGRLVLDSGAGATKITSRSDLVKDSKLWPGGETSGLGGASRSFQVARGLRLGFAGHVAVVDARVSEEDPSRCAPDGLLGLDALRYCALVMSERELAIACTAR